MISRRKFLHNTGGAGLLGLMPAATAFAAPAASASAAQRSLSLNGRWSFRTDPDNRGLDGRWFDAASGEGWETVEVPHTWQVMPGKEDYFGAAWYARRFYAPEDWKDGWVRAEFEAVYHSARVWLNGKPVGEHLRKGYTAFFADLSPALRAGAENLLVLRVDNSFDDDMLPRGHSYDWAADGGITRPVQLHITANAYTERVAVDAVPDLKGQATVTLSALVANRGAGSLRLRVGGRLREEASGRVAAELPVQALTLPAGESRTLTLPGVAVQDPLLWHFDHPHLYVAELELSRGGEVLHRMDTVFGIRDIAVRDGGFYLNGERVWLMGVERMAGSHPDMGMAETGSWITHDHRDLSELNCVFTRAHWQQDRRVLDYCDRHGILIQCEVPTWGPNTFRDMKDQPRASIMENGLAQLQEMIHRDRNHPCIFSWGLCNEINGQHPPAYRFAQRMLEEAKKLDPRRLCSYASNSLQKNPARDVSQLMDFVEWNEYYESWYPGTVKDMEANLEEIHKAFPDKPIVISEYGWCRCTADRHLGDPKKIDVLRNHNAVFRKHDYVGGLIFFSYNDYRTHIGDKGIGPLKQRVHGVVDLYGGRKPSFEVLRRESGPVEDINGWVDEGNLQVSLRSRAQIPAYTLKGYTLQWVVYGDQDIPLEKGTAALPALPPGGAFSHRATLQTARPERIVIDLLRPTGLSVITHTVHLLS